MEHVFNVLEFSGLWHVENVPHEIDSQTLRVAKVIKEVIKDCGIHDWTHDAERRATLFQRAVKSPSRGSVMATLKASMTASQKSLVISVLMITVGVGWLLTAKGIAPQINWVWTLGMAVCGVLMFSLMGFDKLSFVLGVFFLVCSLMSFLRQQGWLSVETEAPALVIVAGVLMLAARSRKVPVPNWFTPAKTAESDNSKR